MEWLRRAACVGEDPELFFPVGTTGPAIDDVATAKRVCARCPVRRECLNWALGNRQTAGVWGGMGEEERTELLRRAGSADAARHEAFAGTMR
ncbi:WhiB family transcriptional regulator [Streptomyces europaeiscabiei]|uniref:WhiB family transcriptional regulator n=1 Tax=Streptomyces europaeiscabiei TaxID=146819 RepID=UPI0029BE4CAA|nr:WhiB family transcriptional regulator [Streptomyces europaeiscabiei]MDX3586705.1 WhiB family transcriptional regulator [Streptomyces europaeiscabiei]